VTITLNSQGLTWATWVAASTTSHFTINATTGSLVAHSISAGSINFWSPCRKRGRRRNMTKADFEYEGLHGYRLTEGGLFIRGTMDVGEAILAALQFDDVKDWAPEGVDWDLDFRYKSTGLWRMVPCSPKSCGEHGWHLCHASKRGRGVFPGVQLDNMEIKVLEFTYDEQLVDA
jgi:hypothetical protein